MTELKDMTDREIEELAASVVEEKARRERETIKPLENIDLECIKATCASHIEESIEEEEIDNQYFVEAIMTAVYGRDVFDRIHALQGD